jgi:hypothetical protein
MRALRRAGWATLAMGVAALGCSRDNPDVGDGGGVVADLATCQTDVMSDPLHCGACGHDCLGGACVAGVCQATALVEARPAPGGLVIAGGLAFWTETGSGGSVMQVAVTGGMPQPVATAQAGPAPITADGSFVYWINQAGTYQVMRAPVGGGAPPTPLASGSGTPGVIVIVGNTLYWPSPATSEIMQYPLPGGPAARFFATTTPWSIALDGAAAFWTNQPGGAVLMLPSGQTTAMTIASTQPSPASISLSSVAVVWIDQGTATMSYSDSAIWRYSRADGTAAKLTDGNGPGTITVDAVYAYFVDRAGGRILRIALDAAPGTAPTPLATSQPQPIKIVNDASAVYWTNSGTGGATGSVMKIAK